MVFTSLGMSYHAPFYVIEDSLRTLLASLLISTVTQPVVRFRLARPHFAFSNKRDTSFSLDLFRFPTTDS